MIAGIMTNFCLRLTGAFGVSTPKPASGSSHCESVLFRSTRLFGPLVPPSVRNPEGLLDLNKIRNETPTGLKSELIALIREQHPSRARDYETVLSKPKFSPLFESLGQAKIGKPSSLPNDDAERIFGELSEAIIGVDAALFRNRFAVPTSAIGSPLRWGDSCADSRVDFNTLLRKKGYNPKTDLELQSLLKQTLNLMNQRDLATFIRKVERSDKEPVNVVESYPGEFLINRDDFKVVYWCNLRNSLKKLPQYFKLTYKLGLDYAESVDLLFSAVDAIKYDFTRVDREVICPLIDIFEALLDRSLGLHDSIPAFHGLLAVAEKQGELMRALGNIGVALNAGIPMARAIELVLYIYSNAAIEGYAFMYLYDALHSLRGNEIDGEDLFCALMNVSGDDPYNSRGAYSAFSQLLYVAVTHTPFSQQEIIDKINSIADSRRLTAGEHSVGLITQDVEETDLLTQVAREIIPDSEGSSAVTAQKVVESYFPMLATNKLVNGILPYRLHKGYVEGLSDLKKLMKEEYSEGAWMYDPDGQVWYSFGGNSVPKADGARLEFFSYDISNLSQRPLFIHIHPEKCETSVCPNRDDLAMPQFQIKLTKYFASMPSGADFELFASLLEDSSSGVPMEAVIVNSIGITEVRFPNDIEKLREVAATFRDLKDITLQQFDAEGYYKRYGIEEEDITFVRRLVRVLNSQLPKGFEITLHDFDDYHPS